MARPDRAIRVYCRNCLYDLCGLSEHACPECGTVFSPDDPKTYRVKAKIASPVRPVVSLFGALFCLIVFFIQDPYAVRDGNLLIRIVQVLPFFLLVPTLIAYSLIVRGTWHVIRILAICTLVIFLMSPMTWKYCGGLIDVLLPGIQGVR